MTGLTKILALSACATMALAGYGLGKHSHQSRAIWAWEGYGEFIYDGEVLERRRVEMLGEINCRASAWAFRELYNKPRMPRCERIGEFEQ